MKTIVAAALISILPVHAHAATRDVFEGDWAASDCGEGVQCTVAFAARKGGYLMKLKVADSGDAKSVVCSFTFDMKALAYDVLEGDEGGYSVKAVYMPTTEVVISGLPGDECSGADVNTSYTQYGDL
jgi:hypothetical protein